MKKITALLIAFLAFSPVIIHAAEVKVADVKFNPTPKDVDAIFKG